MRRWSVVLLVVIMSVLVVFGSMFLLLSSMPMFSDRMWVPIVAAVGVTYAFANGIIAIMSWLQISPLDLLPEKTLKEIDPERYKITKIRDEKILRDKAQEAKRGKEFNWAIEFSKSLIQFKPNEPSGHEIMAECLLDLGYPNDALRYGVMVTKLRPFDREGYQILGKAYKELNQPQKARENYEMALDRSTPEFRQFLLRDIVQIYEILHMPKEAAEALEEYIQLSNVNPVGHLDIQKLETLKRLSQKNVS